MMNTANKNVKTLRTGGKLLEIKRPMVMGIINVTPDSFYAGSRTFAPAEIEKRVKYMVAEGVDIFDIGGYSSRPGADEVPAEEELRRLSCGLEAVRSIAPDIPVSIDTFRADVARECVEQWKVEIINDISGGTLDPEMWQTVADLHCAYVLMHMRGNPQNMQSLTGYDDVAADVFEDLARKADELRTLGVADIILDPGFGFAKTVEENYRLLSHMEIFSELGMPVLAGLSRKSMLYRPLGITPAESLVATEVVNTVALMKGADILRVHDVREAAQAVKIIEMLRS